MKKGTRILLSLMQLNIGGAETHVVELAKELKRRGYYVVVTSKGGVYVKELEEAGIKHYVVPLQNKNPLNVWKAYQRLRNIILTEKIDIVHSHARIPSFILGLLHKRMKFPFVTTAHWVFNTKYGLKYITNWGEYTIAVSDDIKKYLIDNYKISPDKIKVTINGIDTEKFSPDTDGSSVIKEFGIEEGDRVITYVSRMDEDRSLALKQLLSILPKIQVERLRIIAVGGGNDMENVRSMAEEANRKMGRKAVILTGPRTDINKLIAPAELFIGVSRAALEAMAAAKPAIVAGNEGYIGLFDKSKLTVGINTNFCCRDCGPSTPEKLRADIESFFALDKEKQKYLGDYGREMVKRFYSIAKMAQDCIDVYDIALKK